MKNTVNRRFEKLIKTLGLTKNAFAKQIGVASTQIYNIIGERNAPGFDILSKIAITFPSVNMKWLISGGEGPILFDLTGENASQGDVEASQGIDMLGKIKYLEDKMTEMSARINGEPVTKKSKIKLIEKTRHKALIIPRDGRIETVGEIKSNPQAVLPLSWEAVFEVLSKQFPDYPIVAFTADESGIDVVMERSGSKGEGQHFAKTLQQ